MGGAIRAGPQRLSVHRAAGQHVAMSSDVGPDHPLDTGAADIYTHGHAASVLRSHRARTIANSAAYMERYLTPGASVLDVGCGPATITVEFAERVGATGRVVGVDPAPTAVGAARATVVDRGVDVELYEASTPDLPFADGEFDVVHAHQVLQHLSDPVGALREMARVCRPGGVVAVRDADYAAFHWYPAVPELDRWLAIYRSVAKGNDAEPDAGRHLVAWAHEAGLEVKAATVSAWCFTTVAEREWWGATWADRISNTRLAERAEVGGNAERPSFEQIAAREGRWAAHPDAWFAVPHAELICR